MGALARMVQAKQLIPELQHALRDEIEQVKQRGDSRHLVRYGRLIRRQAQFSLYEFSLDDILIAPDDSPVVLQLANRSVKGTLVSTIGFKATIELDAFVGQEVPQAYVVISPVFLLERLVEILEELNSGKRSFSWNTVDRIFGRSIPAIRNAKNYRLTDNPTSRNIDPSKRDVIGAVLGSDVAVVWGPPGTGKTTALGLMVDALLNAGMRVLVVAHTNIAVDQAMLKVLDACEGTTRVAEGRVLRYGPIAVIEASDARRLAKISPETVLEAFAEGVEKQLARLNDEEKSLKHRKTAWSAVVRAQKQCDAARSAVAREQVVMDELLAERSTHENQIDHLQAEQDRKSRQLDELERRGLLGRLVSRGKRSHLLGEIDSLSRESEKTREFLSSVNNDLASQEGQIARANEDLSEAENQLVEVTNKLGLGHDEIASAKRREQETAEELARLRNRMDELAGTVEASSEAILKNASVVGTTLTKCYMKPELQEERFDAIIIDEASMAPLPSVYYSVGLSQKKVIIVGDFRQLPPIAQADTDYVKRWLKTDIFAHLGIDGTDPKTYVLLDKQYRMHPLISAIANQLVYDGRLQDGTSPTIRQFHRPFGVLALIDSGASNPHCFRTDDHTRFNILHVLGVVAIRDKLVESGLSPADLGIITPYRAQARLIRKILADIGDEETVCSTVHRFQGREKNAIVLDLTDSYPQRVGRLLRGTRDADGGKLLNVAVTRPKDALVILSHVRFFQQNAAEESQVFKVLRAIQEAGEERELESVLPRELASVLRGEERTGYVQQNQVYFQFFSDDELLTLAASVVEKAERRVLIALPRESTADFDLLNILGNLSGDRKLRRLLLTGAPPDRQSEKLKSLGVRVGRASIRTRLVLVDSNVLLVPRIAEGVNHSKVGIALYNAENAIEELLKLWRLQGVIRDLEDETNPVTKLHELDLGIGCPKCGKNLRVLVGPYGPYVRCASSDCDYKENLSDDDLEALIPDEMKICEKGHQMRVVRSWKAPRKGIPFLGCSQYPDCKATKPLSRGRVFR